MSNYENYKKEAKKLLQQFKGVDLIIGIGGKQTSHTRLYADIFSKTKGYNDYASVFSIQEQEENNIKMFPDDKDYQIFNLNSFMDIQTPEFVNKHHTYKKIVGSRHYRKSYNHHLYIEDSRYGFSKEAINKNGNLIFIDYQHELCKEALGEITFDINLTDSVKIDPINPLISVGEYWSYYTHSEIYPLVMALLAYYRRNDKIIKVKTFREIFNFPYLFKIKEEVQEVQEYLEKHKFNNLERITVEDLKLHYKHCYRILNFAQTVYENDFFDENADIRLNELDDKKMSIIIKTDFINKPFESEIVQNSLLEQILFLESCQSYNFDDVFIIGYKEDMKNYNTYLDSFVGEKYIFNAKELVQKDTHKLKSIFENCNASLYIQNNEENIAFIFPDDALYKLFYLPERNRKEFKGKFHIYL